jgi:xylulokinase
VLEGVAYGLRDSLELMKPLGLDVGQIRASGGGAKSPVWRQILADVMQAEIATTSASEGAAQGAAILAAVGTGIFPSVESATETLVRVSEGVAPSADASVYDAYYPRYRALYPALAREFSELARVVQSQEADG